MNNRRDFFKKLGVLGLSSIVAKLSSNNKLEALYNIANHANTNDAFTLPKLQFEYNALEPFIDEQTMIVHHTKHHKGYVDKLNSIPSTEINYKVDDITKCRLIELQPIGNINLRNNLGGHLNHTLFWELLKPNPKAEPNFPKTNLAEAIKIEFKSFEEFKKQFSDVATKHFGSGWCWLIKQNGKLMIVTTPNQDNPFMRTSATDNIKNEVVLALDVWEHAYYLKYQNKRADYIANWWNIINWEKAETFYTNSK